MKKVESKSMALLNPTMSLLIKLGSLISHYQEYTSKDGHPFDKSAIDSLNNDREVMEWMKTMNKMSLLPAKRNKS